MRKIGRYLVFMLLAVICLSLPVETQAAQVINSGSCGDNTTWTLDSNGTLTISGTGGIGDYHFVEDPMFWSDLAPWYSQRTKIKNVIIEDGVTSIGVAPFLNCSNLTSIIIPDSVTSIGDYAFSGCSSLTDITIPNSVKSMRQYVF